MDERTRTNYLLWNDVVEVHARAESYNLEGFKRGENVLYTIELEEVGDVRGKSLLHLQCHFGLDTLSWARLGAKVTGLDFSDKAIELARSLSRELKIPAEFVQASVYDAASAVPGEFDIVFSSYGAITWLPDLRPWARAIAAKLKPGGFFYICDMHPFVTIFDNDDGVTELKPRFSYFRKEVIVDPPGGSDYADGSYRGKHAGHEWIHTVSEIVDSLIEAGLRIEFFHEFPGCVWRCLPFAERTDLPSSDSGLNRFEAGRSWRVKGDPVPLLFSVKASKPQ
jgi:SAM-dependent methyltransferase